MMRKQTSEAPATLGFDKTAFVVQALSLWLHKRKRQLPQPCPTNPEDCATWWMARMQKPDECPICIRAALLSFLDLSDDDRRFVVAARQDNVFYRGDSPSTFAKIYDETMQARKRPDYQGLAYERMRKVLGTYGTVAASREPVVLEV